MTVLITDATRTRLAALAAQRGTSRSAIAREFIEVGLDEAAELERAG